MASGLIGVSEAAEQLGVHTNTVRRWSSRGLLKSYRIGPRGDRRFRQEDIDTFVASVGGQRSNGEGQCRVLIVEDDPRVQRLLSDTVEEHGCTASVVNSVDNALDEIDKQAFDLVFLDPAVGDADGDGLEVLRAIEDSGDRTVVAVVVGYGDTPTALEAMSLGPMFFVHKPLEARHIAKIISTVDRVQARN